MKQLAFFLVVPLGLGIGGFAFGGEPNESYTISMDVTSDTVPCGVGFTLTASFTNDGDDATGVQFGICHDGDLLTCDSASTLDVPDPEDPKEELDTFFYVVTLQDGTTGFTCGLLTNPITMTVMITGETFDVAEADYTADGELCDIAEDEDDVLTDCFD